MTQSLYPPLTPKAGATSVVRVANQPTIAMYGSDGGGLIMNPFLAQDQDIEIPEVLYLNPAGPAVIRIGDLTNTPAGAMMELQPGQAYRVPPGITTPISVNAKTAGHSFVSITYESATLPATPQTGTFPPLSPVTMTQVIPSYLYQEYQDDGDLQAWVAAYNEYAQNYVDTFNGLNLPIYTASNIIGPLLDWVAGGVYGLDRPALGSGTTHILGPLNTYEMNTLELDAIERIGPTNVTATSDDTFKRIITWAFYKGDGKLFNVNWLKRRIMRFLTGTDGSAPNIDQTYQVSVTFGANNSAAIKFIDSVASVLSGALMDTFEMNTTMMNELDLKITQLTPLPYRAIFKEAVDAGVLELPFQWDWTVEI